MISIHSRASVIEELSTYAPFASPDGNSCSSNKSVNKSVTLLFSELITMRSATFVLPALLHTFLLVSNVYGSDSIRTKPRISRQGETPEGSGAFLVSHAGFDDAKNWCLTAKNGVRNGAQVGLALCDFDEVRTRRTGKCRSFCFRLKFSIFDPFQGAT